MLIPRIAMGGTTEIKVALEDKISNQNNNSRKIKPFYQPTVVHAQEYKISTMFKIDTYHPTQTHLLFDFSSFRKKDFSEEIIKLYAQQLKSYWQFESIQFIQLFNQSETNRANLGQSFQNCPEIYLLMVHK